MSVFEEYRGWMTLHGHPGLDPVHVVARIVRDDVTFCTRVSCNARVYPGTRAARIYDMRGNERAHRHLDCVDFDQEVLL